MRSIQGLSSNSKMYSKAIVFFAFLAMAVAAVQPQIGLQMPPMKPRFTSFETRVVGGDTAPVGAYQYIVSLQMFNQHMCGGSILNELWVVTAAHCAEAVLLPFLLVIKAGKHNLNVKETNEQTVRVSKMIIHEKYKGGVGPYDIALLKLASPLKLNDHIKSIALPEAKSDPTGKASLSGWGSTSTTNNPIMPSKLQHVEMEYMDREACDKAISDMTGSPSPVDETNVCTAPQSKPTSACSGDSGGPLISNENGKPVLTGIVSWGLMPCGTPGAPSVYCRVSWFIDWIEKNMK